MAELFEVVDTVIAPHIPEYGVTVAQEELGERCSPAPAAHHCYFVECHEYARNDFECQGRMSVESVIRLPRVWRLLSTVRFRRRGEL